ncbi:hypothetical protein [Anabaena sp. UHCC 0399]|uniref:hypothetical protein n=1 Tax=Anabaena sp. UHCC 0399 TaxID=3110238 RepID=UPI002B1FE111|nr:hypothetical protein [Anabaena sp. UHCC 0399]MEA5564639.1 hypothetical protein [Anabaena sp. UHCC 0399]
MSSLLIQQQSRLSSHDELHTPPGIKNLSLCFQDCSAKSIGGYGNETQATGF